MTMTVRSGAQGRLNYLKKKPELVEFFKQQHQWIATLQHTISGADQF